MSTSGDQNRGLSYSGVKMLTVFHEYFFHMNVQAKNVPSGPNNSDAKDNMILARSLWHGVCLVVSANNED